MAKLRRAEIWSGYACNSGVRRAVVGDVLRAEGREALDGTDSVTVDFPASDQAVAHLQTRRVLRLVFADTFTEWRISSIREVNGVDGTTISVTADHPLQDMADAGVLYELSSAGFPRFEVSASKLTVTEAINTYVLPHLTAAGYGYFALGTIEPTELQDVVFRKATPLAALRIICDLFRDEETKRPAELVVRRNGTTNYLIDIVRQRGSSATTADIRYKKNLRRTDLTTDSERQATVIQPFGSDLPDGTPSGIARVAFRLGTPTGLVYPITDPEDDSSPILFEDQITGYYVVPDQVATDPAPPPNPLIEITASSPGSPSTVTLASSTGIQEGHVYELRLNSSGDFLREMPSATTITDRKVQALERADILGARNLIGNGWLRLWPDADEPPTDWTYYPDTATALLNAERSTDPLYTQFGGKSLHITMEDFTGGNIIGFRSPVFFPAAAEGLQLHAQKVRVLFKRLDGAAWFWVSFKDGVTGAVIKQLTLTAEDNPVEKGYVPTVGSWVDVSIINVDLIDYNQRGVICDVLVGAGYAGTVEGSVECYIDAVQVTQGIGEAPDGYIEYSGSNKLWKEGNRILATFTEPPEHYEIDVDDLTRFDGTAYPFDQLTLGAELRLTDKTLSINGTLVRLIELNQDYLTPRSTTIKVATRWEQFVELSAPLGSRPGVTPQTPLVTGKPPDTPLPPDDGSGRGSPGNTIITMFSGPELCYAAPSAVTRIVEGHVSPVSRNLTPVRSVRVQVPVTDAFSAGTKIVIRALRYNGDTWQYLNDASDGPYVVIDTVYTDDDGNILPAIGAWFSVDAAFWRDNVVLEWAVKDGDGTTEGAHGNVYLETLIATSTVPPTGEVPDPAPPTDIYAYWPMFVGNDAESGVSDEDQFIPNYAGNGITADLIRGEDKFAGAWDGTIYPAITRQVLITLGSGGGGVNHDYMWMDNCPSLAAGCTISFYGVLTSLGTAFKFVCGVRTPGGLGANDHYLVIDPTTRLMSAVVTENSGPPEGTNRTATSTTQILNGSQHLYTLSHDGTTLRVGVDGVFEGSVACATAYEPGAARYLIVASGGKSSTAESGPDSFNLGDVWFHTRGITDAELAELWAIVKEQHDL